VCPQAPSRSFARTLRDYRETAGLSQEALAEKAGLSARGVSDLERGLSRVPRLDTIARLADAMGLTVHERTALLRASGRLNTSAQPDALHKLESASPGLPVFLTRLLGRERDEMQLRRLLSSSDTRLLTLVGPGGVGKTRLVVEVAAACADLFPDGVAFAPLASLREPSLVLATIAQAVGIGETGDAPLAESLVLALHDRQFLLVLDNCEHLVEAAPGVARVLGRCPGLRVLATSRTRLNLRGEYVFAVRPLAIPETAVDAADALRWPAVALFAERAQAVRDTFELGPEHVASVIGICHQLDGLPLALELAAARVAILSPQALLERLHQRLPALGSSARDAPARQRTLHSTIAWSYDLLTEDQQRLMRSVSVFRGGWTLDQAEAVSGAEAESVLDGLSALVEHNLIQARDDSSGETRFNMLVTIGQFASDQLTASGEAAQKQERHARALLALTEAAGPHLVSAQRQPWLHRLDLDLENIRAALSWSLSSGGDVELGQRLAGNIAWYWYLRGHLQEGRDWQERLLAVDIGPSANRGRALAHFVVGGTSLMQGDITTARRHLEAAVSLLASQGDSWRQSQALTLLGIALAGMDDARMSLQLYRDSVELARGIAGDWLEAFALTNAGAARMLLRELDEAREEYRASLTLFEKLGDDWGRAIALRALAGLALDTGDSAGARVLYEQTSSLFRAAGDTRGLAQALLALGKAALRAGDVPRAREALAESIVRWREVGITAGIVRCLPGLAEIDARQGDSARATRTFAAATRHASLLGVRFAQVDRLEHDRVIAELTDQLGDERFAVLWAAGQATTLDQAMDEAVGSVESYPPLVTHVLGLRGSY
jgi:predicted ATPase/DNA-binding XRE family transcriptional regulator